MDTPGQVAGCARLRAAGPALPLAAGRAGGLDPSIPRVRHLPRRPCLPRVCGRLPSCESLVQSLVQSARLLSSSLHQYFLCVTSLVDDRGRIRGAVHAHMCVGVLAREDTCCSLPAQAYRRAVVDVQLRRSVVRLRASCRQESTHVCMHVCMHVCVALRNRKEISGRGDACMHVSGYFAGGMLAAVR